MKTAVAALLCAYVGAPVLAQIPSNAMLVGAPSGPMLRIWTEIPVRLRTELTSERKSLRVGQRFEVETFEPVLMNRAG